MLQTIFKWRESSIYVSVLKIKPTFCVLIKCYLLRFNFSFFVNFYSMDGHKLNLLAILLRNLHQRGTSQHTVNVNELCSKALSGSRWFRILITHGDRLHTGAGFIGNKQTYIHSTLYTSRDEQMILQNVCLVRYDDNYFRFLFNTTIFPEITPG